MQGQMSSSVLHNFAWNELKKPPDSMHSVLVTLLAFGPDRSPTLIGTGFIVGAYGNRALVFSAAHNLHEGVKKVQEPNPLHHLSALREFLPGFDEIALDQKVLRGIYVANGRVEVCVIHGVLWNTATDIALMLLAPQDIANETVFRTHLQLEDYSPRIGDEVCMLGYADMTVDECVKDDRFEMFTAKSRLILRAGRIKGVHSEGHILCRGPCVETTIPVFGGMSGGPVFRIPKTERGEIALKPFALISHDPDESSKEKNDRSLEGSSVAALLPITSVKKTLDGQQVQLKLSNVKSIRNEEVAKEPAAAYKLRELQVRWNPISR